MRNSPPTADRTIVGRILPLSADAERRAMDWRRGGSERQRSLMGADESVARIDWS